MLRLKVFTLYVLLGFLFMGGDGFQKPAVAVDIARIDHPTAEGGPDEFGYTYKDSNQAGGPVYAWEEISGTGSPPNCWYGSDQAYTCELPIGFSFPFYGNLYSELYFNVDGYLSFGQGWGAPPGGGIPDLSSPNNEIALIGGDLTNCWQYTHIFYQTLAEPTHFIIEAKGICAGYYADPITFQAILYPNGDIVSQYKILLGRSSNFVGIENETGLVGLAYGHPLADKLAIRYRYPSGALFHPAKASGYGRLGATASYQVELENKTGMDTAFDLTVLPGSDWPVTLMAPQTPVVLQNASTVIDLKVAIPSSVVPGDSDTAVIQASAVSAPTITGTVIVSTTATSVELGYITVSGGPAPFNNAYVAKYDPLTHHWAGAIHLEQTGCLTPEHIAIPPDGNTIWVSCHEPGLVIVLNRADESIVQVINNIPSPTGIAFSLDQKSALVGSFNLPQVTVIDRLNYAKSIIPISAPGDIIAAHPFLPLVYITNRSGNFVTVIDTNTLSVLTTINIGKVSYWAAVSKNGSRLYISSPVNDTVIVVDTQSNQIIKELAVGYDGYLADLETSLQDERLFLNDNIDRYLDVYDTDTYLLEQRLPLRYVDPDGSWIKANALDCEGRELYVINSGAFFDDLQNHLWIVDTGTYSITASLKMMDANGDKHNDPGAADVAACPQWDTRPTLASSTRARIVGPGETAVDTFTVKNQSPSPISDTLTIEASGSTWTVELSADTTGILQWKESFTFTVTVHAPGDAVLGSQDHTIIAVRSSYNPLNQVAGEVLTSYALPTYLPVLIK